MKNETVSNMKMAGKTPICAECNKFYSLKKMDEAQTAMAHETALCPKCQTNELAVAKHTPVKAQTITKAPSASNQVRDIFNSVSQKIGLQMETALRDKEYSLKAFGIRYPFLKEVLLDLPGVSVKDQLMVNGKARYSQKLINLNGNVYAMTNDIYAKNVDRIIEWAKAI